MVGVERFELPTLWSQTRCATRLRYTPKSRFDAVPSGFRLTWQGKKAEAGFHLAARTIAQ